MTTAEEFSEVIRTCRDVFVKKLHDYGVAWRIMRSSTLTDQLFIKASRIRSIEVKGTTKVGEGIIPEFVGIINYAIIGLVQLELGTADKEDIDAETAEKLYDKYSKSCLELMEKKNHDYGEAWRGMKVTSFTDLILMKVLRVKQIEELGGKTVASEGIDANYMDMANYAVFALIKLLIEKVK